MDSDPISTSVRSLADLQELTTTIIEEIEKVAFANGIDVFLAYGTALGAVRHRGFIPWDFDGDMHVKNEDCDRLVRCLVHELADRYRVFLVGDPGYRQMFPRVGVKGVSDELVRVDIFPLHFGARLRRLTYLQMAISRVLVLAHLLRTMDGPKPSHYSHSKARLAGGLRLLLSPISAGSLRFAHVRLMRAVGTSTSRYRLNPYGSYGRREVFESGWFETRSGVFEGRPVTLFSGVDKYLSHIYGDYKVPPPAEVVTAQLEFVEKHYVHELRQISE